MGKNGSSILKFSVLSLFLGGLFLATPGTGAFGKFFENFKFQGNTISANNTNGGITLQPNGTGLITFADGADPTKKATFDLSGITTGTTHALTFPDDPGQLVTTTAPQALSNKFFIAPNVQGYLIVGGTEREIRLFEDGIDHVKVKAPASIDSNITVELPIPYPTYQEFLSGSGTYTTPANARYIIVEMVGGGGGGGGSGTSNSGGAGGNGGNTTFGSSLLVANGGSGAAASSGGVGVGGAGGSASLGTGPIGKAIAGARGGYGPYNGSSGAYLAGGDGASSPLGGAGPGINGATGISAVDNSGSGGGGSGTSSTAARTAGGGGGAGGYIYALITNPAASYSYAVGSGGTAGAAGTSGGAGGVGGSGVIRVWEFY